MIANKNGEKVSPKEKARELLYTYVSDFSLEIEVENEKLRDTEKVRIQVQVEKFMTRLIKTLTPRSERIKNKGGKVAPKRKMSEEQKQKMQAARKKAPDKKKGAKKK